MLLMMAAPRNKHGGSEIHRDPGRVANRETEIQREMEKLKYRAGGRTAGNRETACHRQSQKYRKRETQAEKLHKGDQKWGQMVPRLARQTSLCLFFPRPVSNLLGKPPTAAAATIKPDSFWPLPRSPLLSLLQSLL